MCKLLFFYLGHCAHTGSFAWWLTSGATTDCTVTIGSKTFKSGIWILTSHNVFLDENSQNTLSNRRDLKIKIRLLKGFGLIIIYWEKMLARKWDTYYTLDSVLSILAIYCTLLFYLCGKMNIEYTKENHQKNVRERETLELGEKLRRLVGRARQDRLEAK